MSGMHARLSASSAHRWMRCPASVNAEAGYPDTTNEYAEEGTLLHSVSEHCLRYRCDPAGEVILEGKLAPLTEEQITYVQRYVDYVREHTEGAAFAGYEIRVSYDSWVPGGFGTSDVVAIHEDGVADIIDAKFGRRKVEARDSEQLQLYALGVIQEYGPLFDKLTRFRLHIVQPKLDHVDVWEVSLEDLKHFGATAARAAALTVDPNAQRVAGEKQCYWCKARFDCEERAALVRWAVEEEFAIEEPGADPYLGVALDFVPFVRRWADDMETAARARLMSGQSVPGWKLVEGRSTRKWVDEDAVEAALKRGKYKIGDTHNKVLKGIPAIEKLLGPAFEKRLGNLVHKPPGKPALVPEDNPKPALVFTTAEEDFEVEETEGVE